jgi:hypothetical protein
LRGTKGFKGGKGWGVARVIETAKKLDYKKFQIWVISKKQAKKTSVHQIFLGKFKKIVNLKV